MNRRDFIRASSQCHIYDIYLNFDLLWMRWQAHSMDNHRLESEFRNETWWPAAMSNSFHIDWEWRRRMRKRKKNSSSIHSFRWNHHMRKRTRERKREENESNERTKSIGIFFSLLFSLSLSPSLLSFRWERIREKIKISFNDNFVYLSHLHRRDRQ